MRHLNSRMLVPIGSFLAAVALSCLGGGPIGLLHARRAADPTACTGSATGLAMTVAAGTGINPQTANWTFSITDQKVNVTNSKTANLTASNFLQLDVENVVGIDTDGKRHPFGTQTIMVLYSPILNQKNGLPPPGSTPNVIPATLAPSAIQQRLQHQVEGLLPGVEFASVKGLLKAQTTITSQILTLECADDGTELPNTPAPDFKLAVDNNGNSKRPKK